MTEEVKFEEALEELEKIVNNLETEEVSLEDSLEQFQRGIELSTLCKEKLKSAEETLTKIVNEEGEEIPFNEKINEDSGEE